MDLREAFGWGCGGFVAAIRLTLAVMTPSPLRSDV